MGNLLLTHPSSDAVMSFSLRKKIEAVLVPAVANPWVVKTAVASSTASSAVALTMKADILTVEAGRTMEETTDPMVVCAPP